jgi:protein tyrosine/serine phosphatase
MSATEPLPGTNAERRVRVPGTRNLRDVGGYPAARGRETRWRTLFRTDQLDRLPPSSVELLEVVGVRQVIDLRWPHELVHAPSAFAEHPRVAYRSIPLLEDDPTPQIGLPGVYRFILDNRGPSLVEVVRSLLAPGGLPAVIGCAAGKDRTGITIALLLAAVGVPAGVIADDYRLTAAMFAEPVDDEHLAADWRSEPLEVECPPEYMLAALEHLDRRHGGARGLLRAGGLTESDLEALTELLTSAVE